MTWLRTAAAGGSAAVPTAERVRLVLRQGLDLEGPGARG